MLTYPRPPDIRTSADTVSIGTRLQVVCQAQLVKAGGPAFEKQHENIRRGDVIGIVGYAGRTNPKNKLAEGKEGELSVFATEIVLLSPCLHMLPGTKFPFSDGEQRCIFLSFFFLPCCCFTLRAGRVLTTVVIGLV
jgi:lysyl-tRNA synthetase class 2